MDEYFINKEDWDTIVELGVGEKRDDVVTKKLSTATKTAFTRKSVVPPAFCVRMAEDS